MLAYFLEQKKVRNKKNNNNNKKLNMLIYLFGVTWCNDIQGTARAQALCQQLGRVETKPKPNAVVRDNSTIVDKNSRVLMRLLVHCTPAMIVDRASNPYPLPWLVALYLPFFYSFFFWGFFSFLYRYIFGEADVRNSDGCTVIHHPRSPFELPAEEASVDFVDGMATVAGAGDPCTKSGLAIYVYACNTSMVRRSFYSADGHFLIVPQKGTLTITTEFGVLVVPPNEVAVVQRGMHFSVAVTESSRGYCKCLYEERWCIMEVSACSSPSPSPSLCLTLRLYF